MSETAPFIAKVVLKITSTSCKMVYSMAGVVAMYSTAVWFTNNYKFVQIIY